MKDKLDLKNMNTAVVAVGLLLIIAIFVLIMRTNNEYSTLTLKGSDSISVLLLQQKEILIKKLTDRLEEKQKALEKAKTELDMIKGQMNTVKTVINTPGN